MEGQQENSTQVSAINADVVGKWLETPEGKQFIQPKLDSYFNKGLKTWQDNNLPKYVPKDEFDKVKSEYDNKLNGSEIDKKLIKEFARSEYSDLLMKEIDRTKDIDKEIARVKETYAKLLNPTVQPVTTAQSTDGGGFGNLGGNKRQIGMNELANMTVEQINANWDNILKGG